MRDWIEKLARGKDQKEANMPEITTIDEKSPIYPYKSGESVRGYISTGGLNLSFGRGGHDNLENGKGSQTQYGNKIAQIIEADKSQLLLEVGYGSNPFVALGIRQKTQTEVVLLDYNFGSKEATFRRETTPIKLKEKNNNMECYHGNLSAIDERGSELARQKFDAILFNGSWSSGGINFTATTLIANAFYLQNGGDGSREDLKRFHDREFQRLLLKTREHLVKGGKLYMASSRFALHGDGFGFDQLPEEKLCFYNLIENLREIGAKKITIIGMSSDEINEWLQTNLTNAEYRLMRFSQTFYELFHGYFQGPKLQLLSNDGEVMSKSRIGEMAESREVMQKLMDTPGEFRDQMQMEILKKENQMKKIAHLLCSGSDGLPKEGTGGMIDREDVENIRAKVGGLIPSSIARIDAIMAEF